MCGRYAFTKTKDKELKERFNIDKVPAGLKPRYNIAPQQNIPAILNTSPKEITLVRWGLLPHWAKEEKTKYSMINAKAETLTEKPAYRGPIRHKRCLVIADSFYEWKKVNGSKRPFRIMLKDGGLFAFAGIWDCWEKNNKTIYSCSIITTVPNATVRKIHIRMPVILPREREEEWLRDIPVEKALDFLKPADDKLIKAYEISTLVNSPANNLPEILEAVK